MQLPPDVTLLVVHSAKLQPVVTIFYRCKIIQGICTVHKLMKVVSPLHSLHPTDLTEKNLTSIRPRQVQGNRKVVVEVPEILNKKNHEVVRDLYI
jgi:hypothetical protein